GGVADGTIARATAEVAAKLIVELVGGADVAAVVALEKGHDETGSAVAALRTVALDHVLLNRVERSVTSDALNRNDFASGHETQWDEVSVDRTIARFALGIAVNDGDRAGAAIAFGAAFLGASQTGAAKVLEQRSIGRAVREADEPTVQRKFDPVAHNGF